MQEKGGKIIPPVHFLCWARFVLAQLILLMGQANPGPARSSGPEEDNSIWAEIGPPPFGLSPAQLVGPDQPSPFNIIYYIYYILYYIYIYI